MLNTFCFLEDLEKAHLCVRSLDGGCERLHAVDALCGVAESGLKGHVTSGSLLLHVCILDAFRETGNTAQSLGVSSDLNTNQQLCVAFSFLFS